MKLEDKCPEIIGVPPRECGELVRWRITNIGAGDTPTFRCEEHSQWYINNKIGKMRYVTHASDLED